MKWKKNNAELKLPGLTDGRVTITCGAKTYETTGVSSRCMTFNLHRYFCLHFLYKIKLKRFVCMHLLFMYFKTYSKAC